jgi:glycosyl transferase family 25
VLSVKSNESINTKGGTLPVNWWVDAVYVLSVKTFTDRIQHIKRELAKHHLEFDFVFEYDPTEITEEALAETFASSDMKLTHQSLVLKHIHAWRDANRRGLQRILVFEDDVLLANNFTARFNVALRAAESLPHGWLIFLGGADTKVPDDYFLAPGPLVALPIATTEGYVTDLAAIKLRLAWLAEHQITQPADHLIRHLDETLGIAQYWLTTPILEQGSVIGLFNSVLDTHRQKHSFWFNKIRYQWSKFQRHWLRRWLVYFSTYLHRK